MRLESTGSAINVDCAADPAGSIKEMFVDYAQARHIQNGETPVRRAVFRKLHGVAHGTFRIRGDIPDSLKIGIFAGTEFPAWVRFSSDASLTDHDYKTTLGIGIKLFNVVGPKLVGRQDDPTLDVLMQNMDVFFAGTAADMCAFTQASLKGQGDAYLDQHPVTAQILAAMKKPVGSVLATPYWSCIPFALGADNPSYVKYKLEPTIDVPAPPQPPDNPDYLAADFASRLAAGEVRFRFCLQTRTDPKMSIDDATVRWDEQKSPPICVAELILPQQDVNARGQADYGENLSMNIWRVLPEHRPVGTIADARRLAYEASAVQRHNINGIPHGEPIEPRPEQISPAINTIVRAAIHPAIGVARIGDSKTDHFIGPEVTAPVPREPNYYRDGQGRIKRQAARFRIYGYNAAGGVVCELTPDNASITWTAELANRKAQWFQFQSALDIPEAANASFVLRNKTVSGADRDGLAITPGPRSITGKSVSGGAQHAFDTGKFIVKDASGRTIETVVPLGELRTDDNGRLLVLSGTGNSASPTNVPVYDPNDDLSFNNANQWYDDISDGPVSATVTINGQPIPVEDAWVVVGPPNYAPDIISWRTMYELLVDVYVQAGWMQLPEKPSFTDDIYPMLQRLSNLQWVNAGFAAMYGKGRPMNFDDPTLVQKLAQTPLMVSGVSVDPYAELRRTIFHSFRPPTPPVNEPVDWSHVWPWIYGDAWNNYPQGTGYMLTMTPTQTALLKSWVDGKFINDWPPQSTPPTSLEAVPLAGRPAMLDKAALHYCLADTFHPGCELTWPMRHASMYSKPFRIRRRPAGQPEPNYGPNLTAKIALQAGGPLYEQGPGDLSRWMALPWQGDTAFCRSGYDIQFDPYLPTFWAARVPNNVLTEDDYKYVTSNAPRDLRLAAFNDRLKWLRAMLASGDPPDKVMLAMVAKFGTLGIVEARPGVTGDPDMPEVMFIETLAPDTHKLMAQRNLATQRNLGRPRTLLEKAGWASEEQLEAFRRIRMRRT